MAPSERGTKFVSLSVDERQELAAEARSWLQATSSCCGYDCQQCPPRDKVADAISAGITAGIFFAMKRISYRIRAELVCCPDEEIDRQRQQLEELGCGDESRIPGFHHICYWGEGAARLAEDGHSLMTHPYACTGMHEGHCWGTGRCERLRHPLCDKCYTCTVCEGHNVCDPL